MADCLISVSCDLRVPMSAMGFAPEGTWIIPAVVVSTATQSNVVQLSLYDVAMVVCLGVAPAALASCPVASQFVIANPIKHFFHSTYFQQVSKNGATFESSESLSRRHQRRLEDSDASVFLRQTAQFACQSEPLRGRIELRFKQKRRHTTMSRREAEKFHREKSIWLDFF